MTREQKIEKRKARAARRRQKGIDELAEIRSNMRINDWSFQKSRARVRGKYWGHGFECEMRYYDCEARGYCNGDC
jgi:hypothetical protein